MRWLLCLIVYRFGLFIFIFSVILNFERSELKYFYRISVFIINFFYYFLNKCEVDICIDKYKCRF